METTSAPEVVCPNSCDWPNCTLPFCQEKDPVGWRTYFPGKKEDNCDICKEPLNKCTCD